MDMDIILLKDGDPVRKHGFYEAHRDLRGLLHDIAELSGNGDLAVSLCGESLDVEDLSADGGPGESGHDAGLSLVLYLAVVQRVHVQKVPELGFLHPDLFALSPHGADRGDAAECVHSLFESSDTALSGVVGYDGPKRILRELHILLRKADRGERLRQEVPLCDFKLLRGRIALELDQLHAV